MKMRGLTCSCSAIVALGIVASAALADGGISAETLGQMGLHGMTIISDEDAMAVRGAGFKGGSSVAVFGNSFATINSKFGSAHSENGYTAEGKHFAKGANHSFAGVEIKGSHGDRVVNKWGGKGGGRKASMGKNGNRWGGKPGGGHHGAGKPKVTSIKVFAGGFSFAKAR